jgi:hypothetical protein
MAPAAIRHKNPGAMWPGPVATKWGSKKWVYLNDGTGQGGNGKGNKIATFDNWSDGIAAQLDLWRSSPKYKNKKFSEAIATWSGGNHVEAYIKYVLTRIPGMQRDTVMNDAFWKSPNGIKFLKVQAMHEAGQAIPASDADYLDAQRRVMGVASKVEKNTMPVVISTLPTAATQTAGFPIWAVVLVAVLSIVGFVAWRVWKAKKEVDALDSQIAGLQQAIPSEPRTHEDKAPDHGQYAPDTTSTVAPEAPTEPAGAVNDPTRYPPA